MVITHVLPYKSGSKGAKHLAQALGVKRIKRENSSYRPKERHVVINWGCGSGNIPVRVAGVRFINKPIAVARASNKALCFNKEVTYQLFVCSHTNQTSHVGPSISAPCPNCLAREEYIGRKKVIKLKPKVIYCL